MSKVAVIYWSGTGNTKMMAEAVSEGAKNAGADVSLLNVSETNAAEAASLMFSHSDALLWVEKYWRKWNLNHSSPSWNQNSLGKR